jgi:polyisoprenyl-phosphate glycosyltransferase
MNRSIELSIVIPMYNESENIEYLYKKIISSIEKLKISFEVICINDGSRDDTLQKLYMLSKKDKRIKVLDLSRNFGKEIAMTAGIDYSTGNAVVPIDADLQDPPELIKDLYKKWKEGYEVVYAKRSIRKGESFIKKITAHFFYKIIQKMTNFNIPENTGDFRLMDRKVVNALNELRETHRFMKGLFSWVGFKHTAVTYDRDPRYAGTTKWNYFKLLNLAIEGVTSFSHIPLRIAMYLGFFVSITSFAYAIFIITKKFLYGDIVQGYASIMAVILFLGGIQLIAIGIIGEYVGRTYNESKRRPLYFIREQYGFINQKKK